MTTRLLSRLNPILLLCSLLVSLGAIPARALETTTYLHTDIAGSPVAATDANGNIVWRESYRPYGERTKNQPASAGNRQFFHDKPFDQDTGLSYFGARYYDPVVGRFMGVDPQGFDESNLHSFNRYAYGNGNPYRFTDPDGNAPTPIDAYFIGHSGGELVASVVLYLYGRATGDIGLTEVAGAAIVPGIISLAQDAAGLVNPAPGANAARRVVQTADKVAETTSATRHAALNKAKEANDIPRSASPDRTFKAGTDKGKEVGLDERNIRMYEYTNSRGEKIWIREDRAPHYSDGGSQPRHFNAGPAGDQRNLKKQHHNVE